MIVMLMVVVRNKLKKHRPLDGGVLENYDIDAKAKELLTPLTVAYTGTLISVP